MRQENAIIERCIAAVVEEAGGDSVMAHYTGSAGEPLRDAVGLAQRIVKRLEAMKAEMPHTADVSEQTLNAAFTTWQRERLARPDREAMQLALSAAFAEQTSHLGVSTVTAFSSVLTGVTSVFCAAHTDDQGRLHGHTFEVTTWFSRRADVAELMEQLNRVLGPFDHAELPNDLRWSEDIAVYIGSKLADIGAVEVIVARPLERITAKWTAAGHYVVRDSDRT